MKPRYALYLAIVICAMLAALIVSPRLTGILTCSAAGYVQNRFLAYCDGSSYGDYDHGAFWFGLQPEAQRHVTAADVLFIGNSRMQMGLSSRATDEWFAVHARSYYLLGFPYNEKMVFSRELLRRLKPKPRVFIVNADAYFENVASEPAQLVMKTPDAVSRYRTKDRWQAIHRSLCGSMPKLCGQEFAFYRTIDTGSYVALGGHLTPSDIAMETTADAAAVQRQVELARPLLTELGVPTQCILFTLVPFRQTPLATTQAVAAALDIHFVTPQLDGLRTIDGSHLDVPSAERWSAEFLRLAGPQIEACLGEPVKAP